MNFKSILLFLLNPLQHIYESRTPSMNKHLLRKVMYVFGIKIQSRGREVFACKVFRVTPTIPFRGHTN